MSDESETHDAAGEARGEPISDDPVSPPPALEEGPGVGETLPPDYRRPAELKPLGSPAAEAQVEAAPAVVEVEAAPAVAEVDVEAEEPPAEAIEPDGLDVPTPARRNRDFGASWKHIPDGGAERSFGPLDTIGVGETLNVVRGALQEGAAEETVEAVLERSLRRAARRLERLRRQGMKPLELEGRLRAAETLASQGEARSALLLVEEVLVLAKVMAEFGEPVDPLAAQIEEGVARGLQALLGSQELAESIATVVLPLLKRSEERQEARLASQAERTEDRLSYAVGERTSALRKELAERLAALLGEERFAEAAAAATAARPDALLDRPETLARIEALAEQEARWVMQGADLREQVGRALDERIDALLRGPRLAERIEAEVERRVAERLGSVPSAEEVDQRAQGLIRETLRSPELRARFETLLSESGSLDAAVVERVKTSLSFRELVDERIGAKARDLLDAPAIAARLAEVSSVHADELLGQASFKSAVDERVNEGAKRLFQSVLQKLDQRLDEFLASKDVEARFKDLLVQEFKKRKKT